MTELSINISFPKDFSKESEFVSSLCSILQLIIRNANYITNAITIEKKATTSLGQQISEVFSPFISEVNALIYGKQSQKTPEEITDENQTIANPVNFRKLIVFYLTHLQKLYGVTQIFLNGNLEEGLFKEINDKIPILQKKIDQIRLNCETLSQIKLKYKGFEVLEKKIVKELEEFYKETENIKNDVKKSYQTNTKDKATNDLLNKLNEYDENISSKQKIFSEGKGLEKVINEELKKFLQLVFQSFYDIIMIFKADIDKIIVLYQNQIKANILQTIQPYAQQTEGIQIKEIKGIKGYSFDKDYTLNNCTTSQVVNELLDEVQSIINELLINKTLLIAFNKRLSNVIQIISETSNQFTKNIKGLHNPNLNIDDPNAAIIMQMTDYLRSVLELFLKKIDEKAKTFSSSFIVPIEAFIKEFSSQESLLVSTQTKITKEYSSFRINSLKLFNEREALNNDYNQMKASFEQDPSILKKKEADFLSMKGDIEKLQTKMNDQFNKFKGILMDYYENTKKQIPIIVDKANAMMNEIKESICLRLQMESKTFTQIDEYFFYKQQIICNDDKIVKYVKSTFTIFSEGNKLDLPKEYIEGLGKDLSLIQNNSLISSEETMINNDIDLTTIIPDNVIGEIRNNISALKSNNKKEKEMSVKNLKKRKMHENTFYLDDDENVIACYAAALSEKIILQGKLFLTNKKLVFFSWFNPSTIFGRTLIELPKEDITAVEKKDSIIFSNNLEVITKGVIYLFYNLKHQSECYRKLRELCFNEMIETQSEDHISAYSQSPIRKEIDLLDDNDSSPKKNDDNVQQLKEELKVNYIEQINTFGSEQKKLFEQLYPREINAEYLANHPIGDLSLSEIYNSVYNPNASLALFGNKSFVLAYNEKRQDYDIEITKKEVYENIPLYFISSQEKDLIEMTQPNNDKAEPKIEVIEYSSKCIHPILNKRLGGPSKLNVNEVTNVYFVSPICLVAEVKSYMSGFMLMDCFVAILRYYYNSDIFYDQNHELHFDTKLTITFSIEFLKDTWFKSRITSEANSDNTQLVKETLLPLLEMVFKDLLKNKDKAGPDIMRANTWAQPSNPVAGVLDDELIKKVAPSTTNNLKTDAKKSSISSRTSMSKYLNVKDLPYKQRMIILFCILFLLLSILIKVFPIEYNVLIVLNIIGFGFVLFKLSEIEQMIINNNNNKQQK